MANSQGQSPKLDRYVVIHAATTCDEHGVYVTKDSAEVIELGWILLDSKTCEEVFEQLQCQGADWSRQTYRGILDHARQRVGEAGQHSYHATL